MSGNTKICKKFEVVQQNKKFLLRTDETNIIFLNFTKINMISVLLRLDQYICLYESLRSGKATATKMLSHQTKFIFYICQTNNYNKIILIHF